MFAEGSKSNPCLINCTISQSDIAKNGHPSSNGSILRMLTDMQVSSVLLDKPFENNHAPKCAGIIRQYTCNSCLLLACVSTPAYSYYIKETI